jgi:predicted nucleic acid-binding protein
LKKLYTVDTSIFAASLLEKEDRHLEAKEIINDIINSNAIIILPYTVLIELSSVIIRRTRSKELALKAENLLLKNLQIQFIGIDKERTMRILALSKEVTLRSLDCFFIILRRNLILS